MNVFELFAKLSLDTSGYTQPLNDAEKSTDNFKKDSEKSFESVGKSSTSFGQKLKKGLVVAATATTAALTATKAAAVATTAAFIKGIASTASYGDTIDKQSQKVGFSKKSWQEWDYVLKLAGTDMQSTTVGIKTMTNQVDKAKNGNKEAVANFKALGISIKDLKNMSREDVFGKIIQQMQKMPDSTKRAALANKIFGRSGQDLTPIFNQTNAETKQLIKQANDYGMIMDDKAVKASANFQDSLTTLKNTITGVKNTMLGEFLPGVTTVMDGLAKIFAGKDGGEKTVEAGLRNIISKISEAAPKFIQIAGTVVNSLIQGFGPMLPSLTTSIFSILTQAITTVSSMIPQLMPSIISGIQGTASALMQALPVIIGGVTQLLMALATWLSDGNNVQMIVSGVVQLVTQLVNSFGMILPVLLPAIVTIISEVAKALTEPNNVKMLLDAVLTIIGALAVAIVKSLPVLAKAIGDIMKNLGNLLADFLGKAVPIAAKGFEAIFGTYKKFGAAIKTAITTLIGNIKTTVSNWISNLKQGFIDGFNAIRTSISRIITNIGTFVSNLISKIKELPSKAMSIGKDLLTGLWNGISSKVDWIKDRIKSMGSAITKAIKKVFGISSPSKLWKKEVGSMLALGLGEGFTGSMPKVVSAMVDEAKEATKSVADVISAGSVEEAMSGSTVKASAFGRSLSSNSSNFGPVTLNIYGAEGQDIRELAKLVTQEIQNLIDDKEKAYA